MSEYNKQNFLNGLATAISEQNNFKNPFWLIDFNYIENSDGTYTLISWKGTLNGKPSNRCVIPDSPLVILDLT